MFELSRQLPNFFLLGAVRTGTASLAHYLQQHPAVCFTEPSDTYFFQDERLYQQGLGYYHHTFCRDLNGQRWRGEASSTYFAQAHLVGPRLRAHFGDAPLKFIVLLREPVSRAWSHYLSLVQNGYEERDFATALAEERENSAPLGARYFAEGCYARHLKEWQTYYPLEDFLLLLSEDLAADPLAQVQRVFRWFGIDPAAPVNVSRRLNRNGEGNAPEAMRLLTDAPAWLRSISERIWPHLKRRHRLYGVRNEGVRTAFRKLPSLDPQVEMELRRRYQSEVLALSQLLGRYLSHWLPDEELLERFAMPVSR